MIDHIEKIDPTNIYNKMVTLQRKNVQKTILMKKLYFIVITLSGEN